MTLDEYSTIIRLMKWEPKYTITSVLLSKIKQIYALIQELNGRKFSQVILMEYAQVARELSAHASTSIEGNPLPLTEVKKILKSRPRAIRDSEREVINYNHALVWLTTELKDKKPGVTAEQILKIHGMVTNKLLPDYAVGHWRQKPVVVNDPARRQVVYLPPDWQKVGGLVGELIGYIRQSWGIVDPIIVAGVMHKQLVVIHPFTDGNGRTTRLVTKMLLAGMGLDTFNLFSFENYYNQNVSKYFKIVGEYGDYEELKDKIDFTPWLIYFAEGIIDELLRVQKLLGVVEQKRLATQHEVILRWIKEKGSINDREYGRLTERAKATRVLDFNYLIKVGLIRREGKGKNTFYVLV